MNSIRHLVHYNKARPTLQHAQVVFHYESTTNSEFSDISTYFPSFPSSCSRSAGATRIPINSVARISFSWGNKAGFIIKWFGICRRALCCAKRSSQLPHLDLRWAGRLADLAGRQNLHTSAQAIRALFQCRSWYVHNLKRSHRLPLASSLRRTPANVRLLLTTVRLTNDS